jgi:NDP-sugar pyrophosphorylase family protein
VTVESIGHWGIIAAGEGRRFRDAGWAMPKPLIPVGGVPLIEHAVERFLAAGAPSLVVLLNAQDHASADWIRGRFSDSAVRVIARTTASSFESLRELLRQGAGWERALVSTVDAWCPSEDFLRFIESAVAHDPDATVLAITPFVADARPLWVTPDATGQIRDLGGPSGRMVTAGFYLLPERLRRLSPPPSAAGRLRDFLAWLVHRGEPVYGVVLDTVVDVDDPDDVQLAETLMARAPSPPASRGTPSP